MWYTLWLCPRKRFSEVVLRLRSCLLITNLSSDTLQPLETLAPNENPKSPECNRLITFNLICSYYKLFSTKKHKLYWESRLMKSKLSGTPTLTNNKSSTVSAFLKRVYNCVSYPGRFQGLLKKKTEPNSFTNRLIKKRLSKRLKNSILFRFV